ncbi:bifunctional 3-demethylubiquinone-9 3-methyltransferase/ 2-octaprenyl-6-hydroxy phenol methylase [bacterium BMS3Abin09]|nr:bifunctional 3-demethylubiquinone-9 3-methyltransferase/ 2-octaprenyl-6-hydroxy phenol methylase [bacterium BMS3Abin09]GBE41351.1 bifunctional 3-demethylubiquinone-9 3-methyltransferase/ 2-octaprenyl-6-hydroxy phenol methylase [bacterium BMS3Bbin09]HDN94957.1 class I SAM-dependent methyltransferase [Nitrospirota bacterium]HDO67639.1 class I SAM-dependent methyltransferase [Nitrospirota bacterium]HEW81813.1 class I SAM-dependent methyltransferase [Nitrospirota bacterium]
MTDFNNTRWADQEFAKQYRDNANIYIVERQRMFGIMRSFFRHFVSGKKNIRVLDLGCGDGIVTRNILDVDNSISATLVDASDDMLEKAKERLKGFENADYIKATFQEIIEDGLPVRDYDIVLSSMAIHHLTMDEKSRFFRAINAQLRPDGHFINIDVVLPPTDILDGWYMKIWEEWMTEKRAELKAYDEPSADVIARYKDGEENQPDRLEDQLDALRAAGFRDADCYYKYGIFVVYGGTKGEAVYFPDI